MNELEKSRLSSSIFQKDTVPEDKQRKHCRSAQSKFNSL